jgi:hypothetical protein
MKKEELKEKLQKLQKKNPYGDILVEEATEKQLRAYIFNNPCQFNLICKLTRERAKFSGKTHFAISQEGWKDGKLGDFGFCAGRTI